MKELTMFEKEAEEWVRENMDCCKTDNSVNQSIPYFDEEERCCAKSAFQDGAIDGYNKAKEEMQEQGLALQSDMDKTIEQNIALKEQIEKMKCCGNCAHLCECGIRGYEECKNFDKWELREIKRK